MEDEKKVRTAAARRSIAALLALTAVWLTAGGVSFAQTVPEGEGQQDETGTAAASEAVSKFSFHAYVNQAFAKSDDHQIFGITEDGTTNYRNIALQFRYQFSPKDRVVAQLSHERLGQSTINKVRDEVELDWAFYERRLTDATSLRVGRMQLPLGIYNEIRDVGTLLPFYAPPFSVYLESFTSESVEGVMVSHTFAQDSEWSIDGDVYYGGWDRIEQDAGSGAVTVARAEDGIGTQLWLNTPVSGLRFGLAAFRFDLTGRLNQAGDEDRVEAYVFSVDGSFDRFYTRGEYLYAELPFRFSPALATPKLEYVAYYGQAGVNLTTKLNVNLQAELARIDVNFGSGYADWNRDFAVGLGYKFESNVVAKLEAHRNKGSLVENERLPVQPKTKYAIASLAVSF